MTRYTTEELIQYLYKETTEEQSKKIEKAIEDDWNVRERIEALQESMQQLDTAFARPRQQSVMAILNYAKASAEVAQA